MIEDLRKLWELLDDWMQLRRKYLLLLLTDIFLLIWDFFLAVLNWACFPWISCALLACVFLFGPLAWRALKGYLSCGANIEHIKKLIFYIEQEKEG